MSDEPRLIVPEGRAVRPSVPPPEIVRYEPPVKTEGEAFMAIIERMVREQTFDFEKIQQMLALKKEFEANEARKAFVADMAAFKLNPPKIYKNKHVGFAARDANKPRTDYDHATHAEVTMKTIAALAAHGFSHRWVTSQPNGQVCVTCIITHRLGHSEEQAMTAPPDTTGNKSPVQAIASTKTLLERYTLQAATGLSADDMPDADDKSDGGDGDQDKRPEVSPDVWTALGDAAPGGEDDLRSMWQQLSETTRDTIKLHYASDWSEIKEKAKAADFRRRVTDTATEMRRMMNQIDVDEMDVAAQVEAENERLNNAEPALFNAAWEVLSSKERGTWKGWVEYRKPKNGKH